jgi:hypothetical protein
MALLLAGLNLVRQFLYTCTKWLKFAEDLYETSILERLALLSPGDGSFYMYVQYIVLYLRSHIRTVCTLTATSFSQLFIVYIVPKNRLSSLKGLSYQFVFG